MIGIEGSGAASRLVMRHIASRVVGISIACGPLKLAVCMLEAFTVKQLSIVL